MTGLLRFFPRVRLTGWGGYDHEGALFNGLAVTIAWGRWWFQIGAARVADSKGEA